MDVLKLKIKVNNFRNKLLELADIIGEELLDIDCARKCEIGFNPSTVEA
jgi:hypothetical protein